MKVREIYCFPKGSPSRYEPKDDSEKHLSNYHMFAITHVTEGGYVAHMLTHDTRSANKRMEAKHFTAGFRYDDTYFVKQPLIKVPDLQAKKIGELTDEGWEFIEEFKKGIPRAWGEIYSTPSK